jgi:phage baseplate assembly protein W
MTKHPTTGDVVCLVNETAVKRSLRNLLMLRRGEKPFHKEINSGINDVLFEPISPFYTEKLRDAIFRVVSTYEKRVKINDIQIELSRDEGMVMITLFMTVLFIQTPITYTVNLSRTR